MMEIGKVVNTFGIKGEIKVLPYVSYMEKVKTIYIAKKKMEIEKIRFQKNVSIIKIKGIDDINLVEEYIGQTVEMEEIDAPKLPKGTYYIKDLIGIDVVTEEGELLGKLDNVITTGANDVYQVGKILLPAIKEVIKDIDLESKRMTVHIIKGLI